MSSSIFVGDTILGRDFSDEPIKEFESVSSSFHACRFNGLKLRQACFGSGSQQSLYKDCVFDESTIRSSVVGCARFESCSFRNVVLREFFCYDAEFIDCVFSGVLHKGIFWGRSDSRCATNRHRFSNQIERNDFSGLRFLDVSFKNGVDLSKQTFQTSNEVALVLDAKGFADNLAHHSRREVYASARIEQDLANFQRIIEIERSTGQSSLLLLRSSFSRYYAQESLDIIFERASAFA